MQYSQRYSNFRISEDASHDILICIAADDARFGAPVIVVELPLDTPSDADEGAREMADKIVAMLNGGI